MDKDLQNYLATMEKRLIAQNDENNARLATFVAQNIETPVLNIQQRLVALESHLRNLKEEKGTLSAWLFGWKPKSTLG